MRPEFSPVFSAPMAARLAARAELVYDPPEEISRHVPRVIWLDVDGTQVMIVPPGPGQDWTEVVFRGTQVTSAWAQKAPLEAWRDIRANLQSWKTPWPEGGRVHAGYKEAVDDVADDVIGLLRRYGDAPMVYTGHSLGGVLATLMAARHPPAATYTFGAPSPGNRAFWQGVTTPLHRVVLAGDIAPKYPRPWWGYAQSPEYIHLDAQGRAELREWRWWDAAIVPFTAKGLYAGLRRHAVGGYRRLLELPRDIF